MGRKRSLSPEQIERREEQARPSRFLGYDRDTLGVYAFKKEMWDVAESQFRRAVYLNPSEPRFKLHLAWCLFRQGQLAEAKAWISRALEQNPSEQHARFILAKIEEGLGVAARAEEERDGKTTV